MSFLYDLADTTYKTAVFYQSGTWIKPQGITMISITAIGAGGGGGGGATNTTPNARLGAGGGGSGAITRLIIPEMFISDSLNINVGIGGAGRTGGVPVTASFGTNTYVDNQVKGNGDIYTFVIVASGGTGGGAGTSPGTGAAGNGGGAADVSQSLYSTLGVWTAVAGAPGTAGSTTNASNVVYGSFGLPVTGGGGGGGMGAGAVTASTGGGITGSIFVPTNPGGVGLTSASGGTKGVYSLTPFYSIGGSGGGGGGSDAGGNGGDGNIGCGGGGGGGGTSPGTGGNGGNGGDGLVIIQCW